MNTNHYLHPASFILAAVILVTACSKEKIDNPGHNRNVTVAVPTDQQDNKFGAIAGTVLPPEALPVILVSSPTFRLICYPNARGFYNTGNLQPDIYSLDVIPQARGYNQVRVENVTVTEGETTFLKTINLPPAK